MNPAYECNTKTLQKMRDTYDGERSVKERTLGQNPKVTCLDADTDMNKYLRMSAGLKQDETYGYAKFCDYVDRAMYYTFVSAIHSQSLGMINSRKPVIELPSQFEYMLTNATPNNEPIDKVLSGVNSEQLMVSRIGLMGEVIQGTTTAQPTFNVVSYTAENIIDWDTETVKGEEIPTFINLKECIPVRSGSTINYENQYRILQLDEQGYYFQYVSKSDDVDPCVLPAEEDRNYIEVGGKRSNYIPFVCVNTESLGFSVETPFLEPVADASIKLYQADAEYRNTMYFTSNATLVTVGFQSDKDQMRIGASGWLNISDTEGDAKFINAPADGLSANESNVENLKMYCANLGVDLMQTGDAESGEALNTRLETKTASLKTLSETGANGLQALLRLLAMWQGLNPEDVVITGNTDFKTMVATPKDLLELMGVMQSGGITKQDYFNFAKQNGYTNAETVDDFELQLEDQMITSLTTPNL